MPNAESRAADLFNKDAVDDALLDAVAAAFALVSCADGVLDPLEVDAFFRDVEESAELKDADTARLEETFFHFADLLHRTEGAGQEGAHAQAVQAVERKIAAVRGRAEAPLVVEMAQIAARADHKLMAIEGVTVDRVRALLGLTV